MSGLVQQLAKAQVDQDLDDPDLVVLTGKVEARHIAWRWCKHQISSAVSNEHPDDIGMASKDGVEQRVETLLIGGKNVAGIEKGCNLLLIAIVGSTHELIDVVNVPIVPFLHSVLANNLLRAKFCRVDCVETVELMIMQVRRLKSSPFANPTDYFCMVHGGLGSRL